jgi:hypothetical protein
MKDKILITLLCLLACVANAQTAAEKKPAWDYPVKQGMEEWTRFKSMEEMYQACQIPESILKGLDTESLADICLKFPAPPLFPLFNTPQDGFMAYYSNFNGIRELFNRKDAGHYLIKEYVKMSVSDFNPLWPLYRQGQFISRYKFIEAILSQSPILESLDVNGRKLLLKEAIRKLDEKTSKDGLFSDYSLEMNLWVIGKVLYSENKLPLHENSRQSIRAAMESGVLTDMDTDMLYQQAKKYTYETE